MGNQEKEDGNGQPEVNVSPIVASETPEDLSAMSTAGGQDKPQEQPGGDKAEHRKEQNRVDNEVEGVPAHERPSHSFPATKLTLGHASRRILEPKPQRERPAG